MKDTCNNFSDESDINNNLYFFNLNQSILNYEKRFYEEPKNPKIFLVPIIDNSKFRENYTKSLKNISFNDQILHGKQEILSNHQDYEIQTNRNNLNLTKKEDKIKDLCEHIFQYKIECKIKLIIIC